MCSEVVTVEGRSLFSTRATTLRTEREHSRKYIFQQLTSSVYFISVPAF